MTKLTTLDEAASIVAVADLLRGRIEELALIWCAQDHIGKRKASYSVEVAVMLEELTNKLKDYAAPAQRLIDADDLWDHQPDTRDYSPPRSGSLQSDLD